MRQCTREVEGGEERRKRRTYRYVRSSATVLEIRGGIKSTWWILPNECPLAGWGDRTESEPWDLTTKYNSTQILWAFIFNEIRAKQRRDIKSHNNEKKEKISEGF